MLATLVIVIIITISIVHYDARLVSGNVTLIGLFGGKYVGAVSSFLGIEQNIKVAMFAVHSDSL